MQKTDSNQQHESHLSGDKLFFQFSAPVWETLSFDARMEACQELANRYAAKNHEQPCQVLAEPIINQDYGYHAGRTIVLNEYILRDGQFMVEQKNEKGDPILVPEKDPAPNLNTFCSILHEIIHAISVSRGTAPETYVELDSNYNLYRIQHEEKMAYYFSELGTKNMIELTKDPNAAAFLAQIQEESFAAALKNAQEQYHDKNIEATLNQVIYDRDHGIKPADPSPSYIAVQNVIEQQEQSHQNNQTSDPTLTETIQEQYTIPDPTQEQDALPSQTEDGLELSEPQSDPVPVQDGLDNLSQSSDPSQSPVFDGADLEAGPDNSSESQNDSGIEDTGPDDGMDDGMDME